jgi:allantoate deiminase
MAEVDAARAVAKLKELRSLTGDELGAQRVAWTDTWVRAREWFRGELDGIPGVRVERDAAGNVWATLPGDSDEFVIVGGHIDSVPNGGWLDGALNVVGGLEVLRALADEPRPRTLKLVDWADEEGARFGRSLMGSSACAGTLDPGSVRGLTDRDGVALPDALAEHGVELDRMHESGAMLDGAQAYLELHIEQGPILERMDLPLGAVLGTFGVERHAVRFTGAHAHAGSTPMDVRRDAFLTAARSALAWREDAARRDDVRATTGTVSVVPGIVTAFNGTAEEACDVAWERIWEIEPIPFDATLIDLADEVIAAEVGTSHRLPSGPLHDAAEMARRIPTVMLFVKSLGGVSHTNAEDTPEEDLEASVRVLAALTRRVLDRT